MRPVPIPSTPTAPRSGACATASIATTTSSSPPDARSTGPSGRTYPAPARAAVTAPDVAHDSRADGSVPSFPQLPCRRPSASLPDPAPVGSRRGPMPPAPTSAPSSDRIDRAARWLSLGPASRLLGVDPDTLRRWADEGRVTVYTTPGGHRRFDRRRARAPGHGRRPARAGGGPTRPLASLGATPERLQRVYRRSYSATTRRPTRSDAPSTTPIATRTGTTAGGWSRRSSRYLDADPPTAAARAAAEAEADRPRRRPGPPARRRRHEPDRGGRACSSRRAARSSPSWPGSAVAGRSIRRASARCTRTPRRCSTDCSCG